MDSSVRRYSRMSLDLFYQDFAYDRKRFFRINGTEFEGDPCYYCGEIATTVDHAFPLSALEKLISAGEEVPRSRLKRVPACSECNCLLSAFVFPSLQYRKAFLKKQLQRRYKKTLAMPDWTDRELSKLSYRLQQNVLAGLARKEQVLKRLQW